MTKAWVVAPRTEDDIVDQFLVNRGVAREEFSLFLSPSWDEHVHSPMLFTKMGAAVTRLFTALERGEQIVIHGDYDADGVSGTALLFEAIRDVYERLTAGDPTPAYRGLQLKVFLPDREKDGYGVATHTVERLAAEGAKLLVTVDCGIANADQLDRAHDLGVDVIVCDHHQLGDRLPAHALLLHPLAPGETYPNTTLCGTGVAFKFGSALIAEARRRGAAFPEGYEKWYLDLVAVATVTDVMPLLGENRVLEYYGLKVLQKTRRQGLRAILASAGAAEAPVDTETIGFRIGPRLNAAGRLASAEYAFRALTAQTADDAVAAAAQLEALNRERQNIFRKAYDEARAMLTRESSTPPALVVWKDDWLPGIVGLIAGRLVSDYGVPAFALARVGEQYVGSGRSIGGLHLVEAMHACGDIFVKRGGHPQACGLTIGEARHLETFRERITNVARQYFAGKNTTPELAIDAALPIGDVSWDVYERLAACAPFGEGNRAPVFAAYGVDIAGAETMGQGGKHLRLTVFTADRSTKTMIGFGLGKHANLRMGDKIDVAYAVEVNIWRGRRDLQLRIIDLRLSL